MNKSPLRRPLNLLIAATIAFTVYLPGAGTTRSRSGDAETHTITQRVNATKDGVRDSSELLSLASDQQTREAANRAAESKKAFWEAYTVFMHPRCLNCHPKGDVPFQGDDSHLHPQGVVRGADGKGLYANKCSNCHQPQTTELAGEHLPPSLPTWHLPTAHRKMVFEGKSPRQLAASFKDSSFTGFATLERIIEHVETDPLVRHGFTYGTRPPLTHEAFVAKVKEWIEKGAVLPDK